VFFRAEQNQQWSYFEALYFSYTTLLTIGYGDLYPMSNSGKPFFVFWSLLAVPTLTILISDMGDTVVKAIKEVTIWLGEITVLPSDENSTRERLQHGLYKATLGKVSSPHPDVEDAAEEGAGFQEMHPGLARLFRVGGEKRQPDKRDRANREELAKDFEQSEKVDESEARDQGNRLEEGKCFPVLMKDSYAHRPR
jgi:potassium channel subfamily K